MYVMYLGDNRFIFMIGIEGNVVSDDVKKNPEICIGFQGARVIVILFDTCKN